VVVDLTGAQEPYEFEFNSIWNDPQKIETISLRMNDAPPRWSKN
jgi:hypothetical protein